MKKNLNIGVVGATGMVGQAFMSLLEERKFPLANLVPFASEASLGKKISLMGKDYPCQVLKNGCFKGLDLVFFSSGDDISKEWGPKAVTEGAWAVDNSAAFRMSDSHDLVVPEVNGELLKNKTVRLIANPNCSTIQMVVALKPLATSFGLESIRVASYQAVSGAGQAGPDELMLQVSQPAEQRAPQTFTKTIAYNCVPQIGSFNDQGYSSEEIKIIKETKKILGLPKIKVSAFTVRVPVLNAHSEAVWVTLNKAVSREQVITALKSGSGLVVNSSLASGDFPTAIEVSGKDPVYVGRIHQDLDDPNTWLLWVVSDNLKKGAALNGIQIAEMLFEI